MKLIWVIFTLNSLPLLIPRRLYFPVRAFDFWGADQILNMLIGPCEPSGQIWQNHETIAKTIYFSSLEPSYNQSYNSTTKFQKIISCVICCCVLAVITGRTNDRNKTCNLEILYCSGQDYCHWITHYLGMSCYVNFFGGLGSNEFHIKWRFGTHGSWKNQNHGGHFGATS